MQYIKLKQNSKCQILKDNRETRPNLFPLKELLVIIETDIILGIFIKINELF